MAPSSESESDYGFNLLFTSLSTIKEITDFLGTDEIEPDSRSFLLKLNGRCTIICSQGAPTTPVLEAERVTIARTILGRLESLIDLGLFPATKISRSSSFQGLRALNELWASLCIETHRDSDLNEEYNFNLFLEIDKRWQEAHFLAVGKSQSSTRLVAEDGLNAGKEEILATGRKKVEFLCDPIKKIWKNFPTYRLKFLVENDVLWKLQSEPSNVAADTATQVITFRRFMAEESFNLTDKSKRILAVLLGYAVLHLLETPWLHNSWGPDSILFHRTPSGTPLKPYIELHFGKDIEISATNNTSDNDDDQDFDPDDLISHPYPSLVSLAAMLIELHLARRLQAIAQAYDLKFDDDMNECAKYAATTQIFKMCKDNISEATREAIKQCLDQTIVVDKARKSLGSHALRSIFYTEVVSRLEYDLEHAFKHISIETLDMEAQKLDLAGWGQPTVLKKDIPDPRKDDRVLGSRVQRPLRGRKRRRQDSGRLAWMTLDWMGDSQFFDDQTAPSDISFVARDAYLSWKNKYCSVYNRMIGDNLSTAPVRIAVLDTGLDRSHHDFEAQERRIQGAKLFSYDCQQEDDVFDCCGHGTHVAGLLLDFAPDAELYIAKISDLEPAKPATIAEAIDHAVNVWKVDVISMSFGFPSREIDGYDLLERSIRSAVSEDVLIFAAASNNGANTKRAYPARYPDVICIHSTNANGAPSDFNPRPLPGDNLATIGEAIESAWPVHLCDREMNELCVARKSGTSFATPIASGIAAFLLQYARSKLLPREAEQLKRCHYMKAVLKAVSVESQGYDYIAPSLHPDNAFGKGEASLKAQIRDAMKEV
ncbi:hypothetical protein MKX08_003363 [Trichoderma sp. CBMAI-0020]|nr:hypothetical protein MKX08_003363 [Trichoderma sp. CBMAI-0020]